MRSKTIIKQIIHRNFYDLLKNHQHNSRHSKKFWVLKIIDPQQSKQSFNHHTGVESREQAVGIWFLFSHTSLFFFFYQILEEKAMNQIPKKDQQDSLVLPSITIYHWTSKISEMVMAKITCKTNPLFPNGDKERDVLCEMTISCVIRNTSVLTSDGVEISLMHTSKCLVHFTIVG